MQTADNNCQCSYQQRQWLWGLCRNAARSDISGLCIVYINVGYLERALRVIDSEIAGLRRIQQATLLLLALDTSSTLLALLEKDPPWQ